MADVTVGKLNYVLKSIFCELHRGSKLMLRLSHFSLRKQPNYSWSQIFHSQIFSFSDFSFSDFFILRFSFPDFFTLGFSFLVFSITDF